MHLFILVNSQWGRARVANAFVHAAMHSKPTKNLLHPGETAGPTIFVRQKRRSVTCLERCEPPVFVFRLGDFTSKRRLFIYCSNC